MDDAWTKWDDVKVGVNSIIKDLSKIQIMKKQPTMKPKNQKTVNQQLRALRAEKKIREEQIAKFIADRNQAIDEMKNANCKMQYQIFMLEHKFNEVVGELRNTIAFNSSRILENKQPLNSSKQNMMLNLIREIFKNIF
jgi:hypothetical protein